MTLTFQGEAFQRPVAAGVPVRHAGCQVDVIAAADASAIRPAWEQLLQRALEPVPFAQPDALLPAAMHLADADPLSLVAIREEDGRRLLAVFPLSPPSGLSGMLLARLWHHSFLPVATPAVDARDGQRAIRALLHWLAARRPAFAGFSLPAQTMDGPFARALRQVAAEMNLGFTAASAGFAGLPERPEDAAGTAPGPVRDGIERLLREDATPERLKAGAAILQDAGRTACLRAVSRALAATDDLRIGAMTDGAAPALDVRLGGGWRRWRVAMDAPVIRAGDLPLADMHVALRASGAPVDLARRIRERIARALWVAGRA
jgi:hypothetical protein